MRTRLTESLRCLALVCAAVLGMAGRALAVDGVIEINQARAQAGGVTASDTPGFPVTINTPGSYRLTGNLTPPVGSSAIQIDAENVTVDLNGFTIRGFGIGADSGISAAGRQGITVANGTVLARGGAGLVLGGRARVERVRALGNGGNGIEVDTDSAVIDSTATGNLAGIVAGARSIIRGNTVNDNRGVGVSTGEGSAVTGNTVISNGQESAAPFGLGAGAGSTVSGNTVHENSGDGIRGASASTVSDNSVSGNTGHGIFCDVGVPGCTVSRNTVISNGNHGIRAGSGAVTVGNVSSRNAGFGLQATPQEGFAHNAFVGNNGDFPGTPGNQVSGGISLGHNLCGITVC